MVGLQQVGHAALAGLGVHADDGLVRAADILRIDRQVRPQPHEAVQIGTGTIGGHLTSLKTLLDGILVRTGEGGEHEIAGIRVTLGNLQLVAVLNRLANLRNVGIIDLRIDALREEVQTKRDQIDVAGALAVAQQAAFDTIGTGKHGQLGGGHAHALIVVRVQRQHHGVARHQIVRHVFHLIGEHVRSGHFHRCRQIDDHRMLRSRLDDVDHRIAHLNGVLRLGAGEGFRRILVIQVDALGFALKLLAQGGRVGGELLDAGFILAEHDLTLQHGHGVIEVHDGTLGTLQALVSLANQVLASLRQHHDRNIVRNELTLDQHTDEIVIGFGSRREADLDLLEAQRHQQIPETQLALGIHRVDEGLVAVTKIDGTPTRCTLQSLARPRTLRVIKRHLLIVCDVLVVRHLAGLLRSSNITRRRQQRVVVPSVGRRGDCREIKH